MNLFQKVKDRCSCLMGDLSQTVSRHNPEKTVTPGMPELLRQAAAEGAVLLENRVLPLKPGTTVSVFGRVQKDWFCTGYGSGGDVNTPYQTNLLDGLRSCEDLTVNENLAAIYEAWISANPPDHGTWGNWPRFHEEMPISPSLTIQARKDSQSAIVVIGRSAGEDRETTLEPGSYYLTEAERTMLRCVTSAFPEAVLVLNIGSLMDLSFLKSYTFGAVLLVWQGGMESGNAAADLLCGRVTPSGCLTDTVPFRYEDHPSSGYFGNKDRNEYWEDIYVGYRWFETFAREQVMYPFGYGLSYTTFRRKILSQEALSWQVSVTNTGNYPGKHTLMLFAEKPCSVLGNPARELVAFAKTRTLAPGEEETLCLSVSEDSLCSYDDSGKTGHRNCYVLLQGDYQIYLGCDVREAQLVHRFTLEEAKVVHQLSEAAAPKSPFPILVRKKTGPAEEMAAAQSVDLRRRIQDNLPSEGFITGDRGYRLRDVKNGRVSLKDFAAQLSLEELEAISRGGYVMNHPDGARGNAGVFGGVTPALKEKGIPPVVATDGPSGIRLYDSCSLLPVGTLLACTFNTELVQSLYAHVGEEMKLRGSDVLLAPGMNIHRNPLCGRNFEYFSEDPYLTGQIAAAVVRGVQSAGLAACPKHFACNNQETNRNKNNSILSQRALREIYLRGFQICIAEAQPKVLMTSYNQVNGIWAHYHYDLVQTILRGEWNYQGLVITDWWMQYAASPEFPRLKGNAYRVRAGVDVLMPGSRSFADPLRRPDGTLLSSYKKEDGITLGELQQAAMHVLRCILQLKDLS